MRISFETMYKEFLRVLKKNGFSEDKAKTCAKVFAENSRDGVSSHGLNFFPDFISSLQKGFIKVDAEPEKLESFGALEKWDVKYGAGMINATFGMKRAVQIAEKNGIGCVALKNSNHWMRGATYGWQAADKGCVAICWTTALPGMPPWGGKEAKLGNNPLVIAIPRDDGHIVLDMALSQFSYGKMNTYRLNDEMLPFDGGYDKDGKLTRDPDKIIDSKLAMPVGHWKGAGLSLILDLIAMILSGGRSVYDLGKQEVEHGISQVFTAFSLSNLPKNSTVYQKVNRVIDDFHSAELKEGYDGVRYPGEGTLKSRMENLNEGIPVEPKIWAKVKQM